MTTRSKIEETAFTDYAEFWQHNIDKIDEINQFIEKGLARLERQYAGFQEAYDEIIGRIDTLATIYSNYNSLPGKEYLLRLKALMQDYEKRYGLEGINFNAIHFLHARIIDLKKRQFENFPKVVHQTAAAPAHQPPSRDLVAYPFRWITFEHGRRWYIASFDEVTVVPAKDAEAIEMVDGRYLVRLKSQGTRRTDNLVPPAPDDEKLPGFLLVIARDGVERCYAARVTGKRIFARRDIITPRLKPLSDMENSPRFVRVFGKKHYPA